MIANQRLAQMIRPRYSTHEIDEIISLLQQRGTLNFPALPNGLFPAAVLNQDKNYTGYSYTWVRDNIHIAHAHYVIGQISPAIKTVSTLIHYFSKHRNRFVKIINGEADPINPMNRPHIRFKGDTLEESPEKWAHAQNDALGYFLWMVCKLVNEGKLTLSQNEFETVSLFPRYFEAIRYWQDEDSGHWEETRKVSASSIGVVIAGLQEYKKLIRHVTLVDTRRANSLIAQGRAALTSILPAECVQIDPAKQRPYDAALLFLIYPMNMVEDQIAETILENTRIHLQGEYGIRRYLGDSYWAPDYKKQLNPDQRTADFSDNISGRDRLLAVKGLEAQWCIFDPIISCIYGTRFKSSANKSFLAKQTEHFNRSLSQITSGDSQKVPPFRCPELYYLEDGYYVPNDHVPLLWTQANLMLSLWAMRESCVRMNQLEHKIMVS